MFELERVLNCKIEKQKKGNNDRQKMKIYIIIKTKYQLIPPPSKMTSLDSYTMNIESYCSF